MTPSTFKTEDMTLVTVLKIRGIEADTMEKNNGGCRWVYNATPNVLAIVDEYSQEEEYVEPKEFAKKMALVRREMYQFLDVQPRRVRS